MGWGKGEKQSKFILCLSLCNGRAEPFFTNGNEDLTEGGRLQRCDSDEGNVGFIEG